MRERATRVLSQDEFMQLWQELEKRSFAPERTAQEPAQRSALEAAISTVLSPHGTEGWDYSCDHYGPPPFVCRITLLNKQLHDWRILCSVLEMFDPYAALWVLDLGLVDAIEGGAWIKNQDVARLIITPTEVLVEGRWGIAALPEQLRPR